MAEPHFEAWTQVSDENGNAVRTFKTAFVSPIITATPIGQTGGGGLYISSLSTTSVTISGAQSLQTINGTAVEAGVYA
jgi:hypothetical protein